MQQPVYNNPADYNADIYNMGIILTVRGQLTSPPLSHPLHIPSPDRVNFAALAYCSCGTCSFG